MLERNNKVTNVGRVQFIELVLDVFQLLTSKKLHCAIITIIERMLSQEGLTNIEGNCKCLCIKCANDLFCD